MTLCSCAHEPIVREPTKQASEPNEPYVREIMNLKLQACSLQNLAKHLLLVFPIVELHILK